MFNQYQDNHIYIFRWLGKVRLVYFPQIIFLRQSPSFAGQATTLKPLDVSEKQSEKSFKRYLLIKKSVVFFVLPEVDLV